MRRGSGVDRISLLPEHLICRILSFLRTKDSVRTSVLSSTWRKFWLWVPRLDLHTHDFPNYNTCVSFVDMFHNGSCLTAFKITVDQDFHGYDVSPFRECFSRVLKQHEIQDFRATNDSTVLTSMIPLTLSARKALVCLKLCLFSLNGFESLSLPCLKIMHLEDVVFPSGDAAAKLISCSPVLEELVISGTLSGNLVELRVCSKSLKSLTLTLATDFSSVEVGGNAVVIDAPRLENLRLGVYQYTSFIIINVGALVNVNINVDFVSPLDSSRDVMYNLLHKFSGVRDMTISWRTLPLNPLPKFHNLSRLCVYMDSIVLVELLPFLLESCPNLKYLTMDLGDDDPTAEEETEVSSAVLPRCLVSSLETVEIESLITKKATELKLVRYFLENSTTLKKLVLSLDQSSGEKHDPQVLKQLFESPRHSSLCHFEVL